MNSNYPLTITTFEVTIEISEGYSVAESIKFYHICLEFLRNKRHHRVCGTICNNLKTNNGQIAEILLSKRNGQQ